MSSLSPNLVTEREYLDIERKAEVRSERHNLIAGNLHGHIWAQSRGRPYRVYISNMRVKVVRTGLCTYPDVVAVWGKPQFEDAHVDTLLNPTVIVEVLSDSTEAYDRGDKFAHYRRLETLCEYVLVAQNKIRVEHYLRRGEEWALTEISDPGGTLHLPSIDCRVAVGVTYEKVDFT